MNKYKLITKVKELYDNGENIIQFLKSTGGSDSKYNSLEDILLSYDFQAGSYIEGTEKNPKYIHEYTKKIASVMSELGTFNSVLEIGVGEATTLVHLIKALNLDNVHFAGFDISWSRIAYGYKYLRMNNVEAFLCTGDLFTAPFADSSIDVVYTSHSIEPNGGKEKEALRELYRITNKYLVLLEPTDEFASDEGKKRMRSHGYISNLKEHTLELGYNLVKYVPFEVTSNPLNPTGLYIIEKNGNAQNRKDILLACPISKSNVTEINGSYFCKDSLLSYPVINGIPCLCPHNAILTTKFLDV